MNTLDEQVWSYIGVFSICATFINCLNHISIKKHNDSAKKMPKIDTLDALEEHEEHEDDYQTNSNW